MLRTLFILIIGAAAGSAATYGIVSAHLEPPPSNENSTSAQTSVAVPNAASALARGSDDIDDAVPGIAARLDALSAAVDTDSVELLAQQIGDAAALPYSATRSLRLDALLLRLAELDPRRAVQVVQALRLETRFLLAPFQHWATHDPRAALDELGTLLNPATKRAVALALLDVFGHDERGIERVAAALPAIDVPNFRVDAITQLVETDPVAALQQALALSGQQRNLAVSSIAAVWARQDPQAALAQASLIGDAPLRNTFEQSLLAAWARVDANGVFGYIQAFPAAGANLSALSELARIAPERVLAMLDDLPNRFRASIGSSAIQALADEDPALALSYVDRMPPGQHRESLLQGIGSAYATRDPEAALVWAKSLEPRSTAAEQGVISAIANSDPERALALALEEPGVESALTMSSILTASDMEPESIARFADRLVDTSGSVNQQRLLRTFVNLWSQRDPEAVFEWAVRQDSAIAAQALGQVVQRLASDDPQQAMQLTATLPAELRAGWIAQTAGSVAQYDPGGAMTWLATYRGQPGFEAAVANVAGQMAQSDPRGAARALDAIEGTPDYRAGVRNVAGPWAYTAPEDAMAWVLQLRDERVRQEVIPSMVGVVAQRDVAEARTLVDRYVHDPDLRQAAEEMIDRVAGRSP